MGAILGDWQFSGITEVQSGAPFDPGCGLTTGSPAVTGGYTGTPDVTQRSFVTGDPLSSVQSGRYFNASAFAMPALATGPNSSIVDRRPPGAR